MKLLLLLLFPRKNGEALELELCCSRFSMAGTNCTNGRIKQYQIYGTIHDTLIYYDLLGSNMIKSQLFLRDSMIQVKQWMTSATRYGYLLRGYDGQGDPHGCQWISIFSFRSHPKTFLKLLVTVLHRDCQFC